MNPADLPIPEAAALLRQGELRARELVEAQLDRIAERDPRIGAFVDLDAEAALRRRIAPTGNWVMAMILARCTASPSR